MGLVDAPDPQEAERGLEHCRMVQFLISLSQMVHYKYDQLLEVVELKYLNVCALSTPLRCSPLTFSAGRYVGGDRGLIGLPGIFCIAFGCKLAFVEPGLGDMGLPF